MHLLTIYPNTGHDPLNFLSILVSSGDRYIGYIHRPTYINIYIKIIFKCAIPFANVTLWSCKISCNMKFINLSWIFNDAKFSVDKNRHNKTKKSTNASGCHDNFSFIIVKALEYYGCRYVSSWIFCV